MVINANGTIHAAGADPMARNALIAEREATHGDFAETGFLAQVLKHHIRMAPREVLMTHSQREALDQILTKIARIVCGNPHHADHWNDIAGYAQLAARQISAKEPSQ